MRDREIETIGRNRERWRRRREREEERRGRSSEGITRRNTGS